jgi:hypothetical protein
MRLTLGVTDVQAMLAANCYRKLTTLDPGASG